MGIPESLVEALELGGVRINDKESLLDNLRSSIYENRLRFIFNNDKKVIGFFTWEEFKRLKGLRIFINNLFVMPEYRKHNQLFKLRKFFREMYPDANLFYWRNRKRGIYVTAH